MNYFEQALLLAEKGAQICRPNPAVGAVITQKGKVIASGFTQKFGGPHAEAAAISKIKNKNSLKGSVLYVTLTPCAHHGKTPPCTDLIIQHKIKTVHIACKDPNPLVDKKAVAILKKNNISVKFDFPNEISRKCFALNEPFLRGINRDIPFTALKYAMTLDGKIATHNGNSKWISNSKSRELVHKLRGKYDAIMAGSKTCLLDNPRLNCRYPGYKGNQPLRIILDPFGELTPGLNIFKSKEKSLIISSKQSSSSYRKMVVSNNKLLELLPLSKGYFNSKKVLKLLKKKYQLNSIFIEGGSRLQGTFYDSGLIDKLHVFIAPLVLGDGDHALSPLGSLLKKSSMKSGKVLKNIETKMLEKDIYLSGYLKNK